MKRRLIQRAILANDWFTSRPHNERTDKILMWVADPLVGVMFWLNGVRNTRGWREF